MDTTSIVALLVLAVSVVVPVIYFKQKASKTRIANLKEINVLAGQSGCVVTDFDYWTAINSATKIGIDIDNQKLFFMRSVHGKSITKTIDLSEVRKAVKQCSYRTSGTDKNSSSLVDVVGITLQYNDRKRPDEFLEFFNGKVDNLMVVDEIQNSIKWEEVVNKSIGVLAMAV